MDTNVLTRFFVIFATTLVAYTSSQDFVGGGIPEHCSGNAELLYRFCCVFPPFFTRDVAKECGGGFALVYLQNNITGIRRHSWTCGYWYCVLDKYGFITPKGYVDNEKFFNHLDLWANLNPSFSDVMLDAKVHCKQTFRFFMPLKPCEFYDINMCLRNYIRVECPAPIESKECKEQRLFFKHCGKYFH